MSETQVGTFTVGAELVSSKTGEFLKYFRQEFDSVEVENRTGAARMIISELMQLGDFINASCRPPNQWETANSNNPRPQDAPIAPPCGPRNSRKICDGTEPLEHTGHEALAQFLATPRQERECESIEAFAEHFGISRMTVYRWRKRDDVLRRAHRLTRNIKLAGEIAARCRYERAVEAVADRAEGGDVAAAKLLKSIAWPEDRNGDSVVSSLSIDEALNLSADEGERPSWKTRPNTTGKVVRIPDPFNESGGDANPEKKAD